MCRHCATRLRHKYNGVSPGVGHLDPADRLRRNTKALFHVHGIGGVAPLVGERLAGRNSGGRDRMIQRAEQANIVGLRSKDFVQWVGENIDAPMKRGPGGRVLERLKAGLVGEFFKWAKRNSTWPLVFGILCCAIEMAATSDPRYDVERVGVIYRSSPRQCDVLLLNGPISLKLRPAVRRLYEQMAEPKWVIAMGECTICGGPYYDSYSIVKGSYTFVPTDIFIPGCPVRPAALIDGFLKLSAKIKAERSGWVRTKKGRLVSAREGQLMDMQKGEYTYEVPQVRS